MRSRNLPPPTQFTLKDKYQILLGGAATVLGIVILLRTMPLGFSPPAVVLGLCFIGFGVYRLWLGYTRIRQFYQIKKTERGK